jgi:hypothetical protein
VWPGGRTLTVRCCVDWSEQRHHLAGGLATALLTLLIDLDWICRAPKGRYLTGISAGMAGLQEVSGTRPTRWRSGDAAPNPVAHVPLAQ